MICTHCVSILPEDSQFCPHCGRPTPLAPEPASPTSAVPKMPLTDAVSSVQQDRQLSQANAYRLKKDWEKATDTCIQVLKADPANATAHSLLGDIYREQGKTEDALRWYQMAVELKPTPADKKKLADLEKEFALKSNAPSTKILRGGITMPVNADGTLVTGTTRLAGGVSPQNWLRWVTAICIAFLGITLIGLAAFRMGQRTSGTTIVPQSQPAASGIPSNSVLPPTKPIFGTNTPSVAPPASTPPTNEGGTGFPADRPGAGTPNKPPTQQPNSTSGIAPPNGDPNGLATAKINSVAPAPPPTQPRLATSEEEEGGNDKTTLPGNMWIAGIEKGKTEQQAQMEIGTPFAAISEMNADQRRQLVRNLLRAGKRAFNVFPALQALELYATNDSRAHPESRQTLLTAQLERDKLSAVDIGNATEEQLTQALTVYQWAGAKPDPKPNSTPAKPVSPPKPEPSIVIELNTPKKQ